MAPGVGFELISVNKNRLFVKITDLHQKGSNHFYLTKMGLKAHFHISARGDGFEWNIGDLENCLMLANIL